MVEFFTDTTIIYTDYGANVGIVKQTFLTTASTDKLNLRLVRTSEFFQRFNFKVRYKAGKTYFVPDTLFKLISVSAPLLTIKKVPSAIKKLDALNGYAYTTFLVKMSAEFK